MSAEQRTVRERMSELTHTIGDEQTLAEAAKRMHQFSIRHLAVLRGGHLIGIISERDVALVESFPGVDPETTVVAEAMTDEPYTTGPDTKLTDVLHEMATHKYGAALIADGGKPVGIFTTIDAVLLARDLLRG